MPATSGPRRAFAHRDSPHRGRSPLFSSGDHRHNPSVGCRGIFGGAGCSRSGRAGVGRCCGPDWRDHPSRRPGAPRTSRASTPGQWVCPGAGQAQRLVGDRDTGHGLHQNEIVGGEPELCTWTAAGGRSATLKETRSRWGQRPCTCASAWRRHRRDAHTPVMVRIGAACPSWVSCRGLGPFPGLAKDYKPPDPPEGTRLRHRCGRR